MASLSSRFHLESKLSSSSSSIIPLNLKIIYEIMDITWVVLNRCLFKDTIRIPSSDSDRSKLFSDPCPGILKSIIIFQDGKKQIYPSNQGDVELKLSDEQLTQIMVFLSCNKLHHIVCNNDSVSNSNDTSLANTHFKLLTMHNNLILCAGSFSEEYPEQVMITEYLPKNAKVLEIGSNIGRSSLIIATMLQDQKNFVTLESDLKSVRMVTNNRDINGYQFHIESSALSNRRLIQQGWATKPFEPLDSKDSKDFSSIPTGWMEVKTISLPELREKYNISFDTLVLDCEGAFYYILKDTPEILDGIKMVIVENDYTDIIQKKYVDDILLSQNFKLIYSKSGGFGPCMPNFYQVWKK